MNPADSFGVASLWVTAKRRVPESQDDRGFGVASLWVTAKRVAIFTIEAVSFGVASLWVTAKLGVISQLCEKVLE